MKNSLAALSQIADTLYAKEVYYLELYDACQNFKSLLLGITQISLTESDQRNDIYADTGRAIGTEFAIRCVEDIMRTRKYCQGLYEALKDKSAKKEGSVRVLYAGSGPFATLVLPLITRFTPEQLQIDIIEINPASAEFLKTVISHFNMADYIGEFAVADATQYQIPHPKEVDVLVSETMQAALAVEPQVAISYHLMGQLPEDCTLIPEEISLHLYAIEENIRQQHKLSLTPVETSFYKDLGLLFTLNKAEIQAHKEEINAMGAEARFPPLTVEIPSDTHRKYQHLMIATKIKIYKNIEIALEESGLTALRQLQPLNPMMQTVKALQASYLTGAYPGLDFQMNP